MARIAGDETAASADPPSLTRWWRIMDFRIGIVPAPVFAAVLAVAAVFVSQGKVSSDILMNMAVLAVGGFACAELGRRLPLLRNIDKLLTSVTGVPCHVAEHPLNCVAIGTGRAMENFDVMRDSLLGM